MKKLIVLSAALLMYYFSISQNVGIGNSSPQGKLHIKGSADTSQLVIDAGITQSNSRPLIRLRNNNGTDLMWIHSDDTSNVFIGRSTGRVNTVTVNGGFYNTFIGGGAAYSNTNGYANTVIGANALHFNTTGSANNAIGCNALYSNITGQHNTAVGWEALYYNNTGFENTAVGASALYGNTNGRDNTAIGINSLSSNTTGGYNTANGVFSLLTNSTGSYNTAHGANALHSNSSGDNNTAFGFNSLYSNSDGIKNTANGSEALFSNTTGNGNIANGASALYTNTTGSANIANGIEALYSNTTGNGNIANGSEALFYNTTGSDNTAIGNKSLRANINGTNNISIGTEALSFNTSGSYNVATGESALNYNTTGEKNIAIGTAALNPNTTGNYNVAIGWLTLFHTPTSDYNTVIGNRAGDTYNLGWNNTLLGANSDVNATGAFNSIAIGESAIATASSQARIGNSSVTSIGGFAGWSNVSDGRVKQNVQENVPGLSFINKLKPVTYHLNLDAADKIMQKLPAKTMDGKIIAAAQFETDARKQKEQIVYTGFIAQDVEKAAKELGYDFSGVDAAKNDKDLYGLRYAEFVVPLVKAVQEQQVIIEKLTKQVEAASAANMSTIAGKQQQMIDALQKENEAQKNTNANLQKQMNELKTLLKK